MKIPKEFKVKKKDCKASTNSKGLLSSKTKLSKTMSNDHYLMLCLINGNKPLCEYSSYEYELCPNKLINNVKVQIIANKANISTILVTKHLDKKHMICYNDVKNRENAYLCAYLMKTIIEAKPEEQHKYYLFNKPYHYILGKLFGYSYEEIRGYYLQRYMLKALPPKIKKKMNVEESNFDLDIISYKTKLEKIYKALEKVDNFKDFDIKYKVIKQEAFGVVEKMLDDKKFKKYKQYTKPVIFKFKIDELKNTYPDEYKKLKPILLKFEKSLTK